MIAGGPRQAQRN